jgi:hypothetical protein
LRSFFTAGQAATPFEFFPPFSLSRCLWFQILQHFRGLIERLSSLFEFFPAFFPAPGKMFGAEWL